VGEGLGLGEGPGASQYGDIVRDALAEAMSEGDGLGLQAALSGAVDAGRGGPAMVDALWASAALRGAGQAEARLSSAPIRGAVSSEFGDRVHPITGHRHLHEGLDLAAERGTPVVGAGAGVVVRAEEAGHYGNLVVVDHGDGLETRYAHLDTIAVKVGEHIGSGQPLGTVGDTGRTTGPHLHFEVRRYGQPENPLRVVGALNAAGVRSR
jgi:murein DD-endopeptidase MepM/ murein hydrolase activator NlpD